MLSILFDSLAFITRLSSACELVLFEVPYQSALVLAKGDLGQELTQPLHVEKLDDIDLVFEPIRRLLMPPQSHEPPLVPVFATDEAAAQRLQEVGH